MKDFEALVAKRLSGEINGDRLSLFLDLPFEKGGVGLNFKTAKNYAFKVEEMLNNIRILQMDLSLFAAKLEISQEELKAKLIVRYFVKEYLSDISIEKIKNFEKIILKRINNEIDNEAVAGMLNASAKESGAGLDSRLVQKIARELELLLLLKFSQTQKSDNPEGGVAHNEKRDLNLLAEDLKCMENLINPQI